MVTPGYLRRIRKFAKRLRRGKAIVSHVTGVTMKQFQHREDETACTRDVITGMRVVGEASAAQKCADAGGVEKGHVGEVHDDRVDTHRCRRRLRSPHRPAAPPRAPAHGPDQREADEINDYLRQIGDQ
jgi:hypothetical protein